MWLTRDPDPSTDLNSILLREKTNWARTSCLLYPGHEVPKLAIAHVGRFLDRVLPAEIVSAAAPGIARVTQMVATATRRYASYAPHGERRICSRAIIGCAASVGDPPSAAAHGSCVALL
jgi:hypothetical protein